MIQTLTESKFVRIVLAATVLLSLGAAGPAAAADTIDTDGATDGAAALGGAGGDLVLSCDKYADDMWALTNWLGGCGWQ
jgi:hypothetical protein